MRNKLPTLAPFPSPPGLALGLLLTGAGLWRSERVFHLDAVIYILPLLQGLGLALMCVPLRRIGQLLQPLAVLALALVMLVQQRWLPEDTLSRITAQLTHAILVLGGQDARLVAGNEVWLPGGGVRVAGPCSGSETIAQMVVVAAILVLAFPLRQVWLRALVLAASVLFAVSGNTLRTTLLTLLHASDWGDKTYWVDFFHEEIGSLVFSALTVSAFAWTHLKLLDHNSRPWRDSMPETDANAREPGVSGVLWAMHAFAAVLAVAALVLRAAGLPVPAATEPDLANLSLPGWQLVSQRSGPADFGGGGTVRAQLTGQWQQLSSALTEDHDGP